jgi:type VI secretion system protein ImpL
VRFLEKIDAANAFLKPMWAQAESAEDGILDARVDFRVNQALEVGGNRIAEWAMRLADARLFLGGAKPEASWRVGDPVSVDLRWAKNSIDVPAPTQGSGIAVDGRTVTFEERGVWALLRLIAFHQTATGGQDPSGKGEAASHVLSFVVQTIPDPTGGFVDRVGGAEGSTVRVFIRLGVMGMEKDKLLKYPEFPTSAPVLPSTLKL